MNEITPYIKPKDLRFNLYYSQKVDKNYFVFEILKNGVCVYSEQILVEEIDTLANLFAEFKKGMQKEMRPVYEGKAVYDNSLEYRGDTND